MFQQWNIGLGKGQKSLSLLADFLQTVFQNYLHVLTPAEAGHAFANNYYRIFSVIRLPLCAWVFQLNFTNGIFFLNFR